MRSALYEWPFTMHLLWEFRCIIDVLLEGIMGLMVAGDFATGPKSLYLATPLAFNSPDGGFPWDDLRKIFRGCQRMAKVPDGVEKLPRFQSAEQGRT